MQTNIKQTIITLVHAFAVWAFCGALIGIGRKLAPLPAVLIVHAIGAPLFAALIAFFYFKKFNYFAPLKTALIFFGFILAMDAGLVAPVFEKNFAMFKSFLGTWLPLFLIFAAVYSVGAVINRK